MSASESLRAGPSWVAGLAPFPEPLRGRHQEGRQEPRLKVFEPCRLSADQMELRAHILNISEIGALLHSSLLPARNERIRIVVRDELLTAKVIWASHQRVGVAFEFPPSGRLLTALLA